MFTSGQSRLASLVFSFLTFFVAVPSAIKVFNWLATMYKASISLATPMIYALSFIFVFTIGGLTGLFLGTLATDVHLHDTYLCCPLSLRNVSNRTSSVWWAALLVAKDVWAYVQRILG